MVQICFKERDGVACVVYNFDVEALQGNMGFGKVGAVVESLDH